MGRAYLARRQYVEGEFMRLESKVGLIAGLFGPFLSAVGLIVSLAGCETVRTAPSRGGEDLKTSSMMPVPSARTGVGAVLVVADIEGASNETLTCRWRVVNQE